MENHSAENLLSLESLTKTFSIRKGLSTRHFMAVDRVSLAIRADQPEIVAIAGESGSGKTTLAHMVLGLVEPTSGKLMFKNRDLTGMPARDRRAWFMKEVQPVFQDPFSAFSPLKKAESYLYETAHNFGIANKASADACVDEALVSVGLSLREVKGRYPNELSGGQMQRVAIARALITNPSLLVADEPVSMLDASLRMSIINSLRDLKNQHNVSIIYITHDLATAYYAADRIAIMLRGWVVELGSVQQVLGNPLHPYTQILKSSLPEPDPDHRWTEKVVLTSAESEEFMQTGCKFAARCPRAIDICKQLEPKEIMVEGRMVKCHLYGEEKGAPRSFPAPSRFGKGLEIGS
jgi:peptide/nickel transport system ATP-binding protein